MDVPLIPAWLETFPDLAAAARVRGDPSGRIKHLIAYDVRDGRRLCRLHKRLKDYGVPVQLSVFECLLTPPQVDELWAAVHGIIDVAVDWVVLYRLHRPWDEAVRHVGCYDPALLDADDIIFF